MYKKIDDNEGSKGEKEDDEKVYKLLLDYHIKNYEKQIKLKMDYNSLTINLWDSEGKKIAYRCDICFGAHTVECYTRWNYLNGIKIIKRAAP